MANKTYIMKTPEKILITIISFLLTFLMFYLIWSFCNIEFDAYYWIMENRIWLSLLGLSLSLTNCILIGLYLITKK